MHPNIVGDPGEATERTVAKDSSIVSSREMYFFCVRCEHCEGKVDITKKK